jgi:teichuronic acid biosynthesis glycosyltransferase TuaG
MKKLVNKKILVSIIIPYHKKKNFFISTIKSIKNQVLKDYEIIIIYDDKNYDEIPFVKKQIKQIKNKKLVINKKIIGPGLSRNIGIKLAKGKYICFCDADDTWQKNKLLYQTNFMIKNDLKFSHSNYNIINFKGKKIGNFKIKEKINYENLLKSCDIGLSTVMIEKNFLKNFKFCSLKTKEDYYLWLKLVKKLKTLRGIKKYLVNWRSLENSLSSSKKQRIKDAFKLYNYYENYNSLLSFYYVLRLSFYSLIKKIKIYS